MAPQRQTLGSLGWAGVFLAALGGSTLGLGGTLIAVGHKRLVESPTNIRFYQPSGYGLLAGGSALAITGIVLVVLEQTKRRPPRRVSVAPAAARSQFGATASFRF